jgi:hypothetical protein
MSAFSPLAVADRCVCRAAQSPVALTLDLARQVLLHAWLYWLGDAQPTNADVEAELAATASALRQLAELTAPRR